MTVEEQREEFIQKALKSGQLWFDKCDHCGSVRHGFYCLLDRTFKCIVCAAEEKFPEPKEPFPVAELKHGGLVPLDVDDFARI